MTRYLTRLLASAAMVAVSAGTAVAQTTIVNFDDLPTSPFGGSAMPAGYGGIDWLGNNWLWITCTATFPCPNPTSDPFTTYPYQPSSFPSFSTVDASVALSMKFGFVNGPQIFNGGWVSTFDNDFFGYVLSYQGSVVFTSALATTGSTPTFVASGYSGPVDNVDIVASDYGDWALDDISYTTPTPEPAALLLLATGMSGVGLFARRRHRRGPRST